MKQLLSSSPQPPLSRLCSGYPSLRLQEAGMMIHTAEQRLGLRPNSEWAGRAGSRPGSSGTAGSLTLCARHGAGASRQRARHWGK